MDVTIFEVHLPDARFYAPFASRGSESADDADEVAAPGGDGPGLAPLAGLAILLGLAALYRYLKQPSQTELDEFED